MTCYNLCIINEISIINSFGKDIILITMSHVNGCIIIVVLLKILRNFNEVVTQGF